MVSGDKLKDKQMADWIRDLKANIKTKRIDGDYYSRVFDKDVAWIERQRDQDYEQSELEAPLDSIP